MKRYSRRDCKLKILHAKPECELIDVRSELLSNVPLTEENKVRFSKSLVPIKLFSLLYSLLY